MTNDRLISKTHKEIKQFVEYDVKTEPDKNKMEEPEDHRQHIKNKRIEEEGRAWLREDIKRLDLRIKKYKEKISHARIQDSRSC